MTARSLFLSQAPYHSHTTSANSLAAKGLRPATVSCLPLAANGGRWQGSWLTPTSRRTPGPWARPNLLRGFPGGTPLANTFAECLILLLCLATLAGCNLSLGGPSPCQAFVTPNAAMEPTFYAGEQVVIDTQAYASTTPRRGQEVVITEPSNRGQEELLRVIGLPGETVRLSETQTFINGMLLSEPFVLHRGTQQPMQVTLGPNDYFLMGDNRPQSTDSRAFGPVPLKDIVAEVGTSICPQD